MIDQRLLEGSDAGLGGSPSAYLSGASYHDHTKQGCCSLRGQSAPATWQGEATLGTWKLSSAGKGRAGHDEA
jgi:hypothetical protein